VKIVTTHDKVVRHSLAYSSVQKWLVGDVPLNVSFALNEPPLAAAAVRVSAFTKSDEYPICIAMIRMQYEICNYAH